MPIDYLQVEVKRSEIEEGNFCDALLDKLGGDDQKEEKPMNCSSTSYFGDDVNGLQF